MDDVWLKKSAQHVAEHLEGQERPLTVHRGLLVSDSLCQLAHDVKLFQGEDSQALDQTRDTVGGSLNFFKVLFFCYLAPHVLCE